MLCLIGIFNIFGKSQCEFSAKSSGQRTFTVVLAVSWYHDKLLFFVSLTSREKKKREVVGMNAGMFMVVIM